ncbi:MAG: phospholipid carrier-dependent glycosyltransferase [Bacteroidota bacterium]
MKYKIIFILIILFSLILRLYKLGDNPPSLYWDEASLGYNAFSILNSGKDEHGEFFPIARFIAFGDFKPPGYIYTAVPSIALFGLTEIAVRLPSALSGVGMVVVAGLLSQLLFKKKRISLLSSFFVAISPWSLQFSRAAFEANLAAFFNLLGIYFFLRSHQKKYSIVFSVVFFVLSFYTFNANRIIAPLLLGSCFLIYFRQTKMNLKWTIIAGIVGLIMVIPSIQFLGDRESRIRYQEVSMLNNLAPLIESNKRIETENGSILARILFNRRVTYSIQFLRNYVTHFYGRFLFVHGDVNPRLSVPEMGELYIYEIIPLLFGLWYVISKRNNTSLLMAAWMLIVPIPAALAKEVPHALRIASILPSYQILIAVGLWSMISKIKSNYKINRLRLMTYAGIAAVLCVNTYYYFHQYYIHYPINWAGEWQWGYKQMVETVQEKLSQYDAVYVTENYGRPYIYFAFYGKIPTEQFLHDRVADRDWYGFWTVKSINKIHFGFSDYENAKGKILIVTTPNSLPGSMHILENITDSSGNVIFVIGERT